MNKKIQWFCDHCEKTRDYAVCGSFCDYCDHRMRLADKRDHAVSAPLREAVHIEDGKDYVIVDSSDPSAVFTTSVKIFQRDNQLVWRNGDKTGLVADALRVAKFYGPTEAPLC